MTVSRGELRTDRAARSCSLGRQEASPGFYRAELTEPGVTAEATVTDRCGLTQFIAREGGKLHVLLNAGESLALTGGGSVSFTSSAQVEGFAVAGGFCGEANRQTVYFAADISRPPADRFVAVRNPYFHRIDDTGRQLDAGRLGLADWSDAAVG